MNVDLKPCPWCGGEAETWENRAVWGKSEFGETLSVVFCNSCGREIVGDGFTVESAIEAWNMFPLIKGAELYNLLSTLADIRRESGVGDGAMLGELAGEIGKKLGAQEKAATLYQAALAWISTYAHLTTPELVAEKAYAALVEVDPTLPQWEPNQNMNSVEEANKKLVAEVERLTAEHNEQMAAAYNNAVCQINDLKAERDAAVRDRGVAVEALKEVQNFSFRPGYYVGVQEIIAAALAKIEGGCNGS